MLLTIHGLPYSTKYQDLKQLIKDKCNISDFILDNLVSEGSNAKKVRIGLTDDGDGKLLMKCLDGIRLGGSLLHVVPVSKNQPNEGPSPDRQGNAKASTFGNPPQYGNSGQPSQSVLWSGNSNLWQPTPLQTNSYNYDAPANVYPAQQAPIAPRAEIPQLNVHQMDAFQNRPVLQQDHCKPIPPPMHPTRTAALREIQTVETAPQNMYKPPSNQYVPNKPMTIKKDNFQGPQSNLDLRGSQMQAPKQSNAMLWLTPGHQNDKFSQNIRDSRGPNDRSGRYSPIDVPMNDARRMPPTHRQNDDRLMSQQSHHMSQQDRRISPQGRKMTPQGRRMSPPDRKISPQGRRMSPQGRKMSPQGRKMSPQGRRMSPQGRKMSPQRHRLSPSYRMMQGRKTSPGRQVSPPRRNMEREPDRYSPKRRVPDDSLNPRPRFDGSNTRPPAPSQAIYGDGFRGNVQYPVTAARPQLSSWQFGNNKPEDDRRPNYEPRAPSPRKSRSPVRRGRSPLKDRFKRHSPSPRSPRRSWALEKRRSPDVTEAPPPPNWPGSKEDTYPPNKPDTFPGVWDRNKYDEIQSPESDSMRSNTRPSRDATPPHRQMYKSEQPQYEAPAPKVSKHQLVEEDRRDFRHPHAMRSDVMDVQIDRPVVRDLLKDRQDYRQPPKSEQQSREEDIVQKRLNTYKRREPEPTRYEEKKPLRVTERLDKEIEDIYKRTAEFKKKAEVFRNAEERRREEERRKDEAFQESLRHSMERDPPKDRHDFRKDNQRPDDRRPDDRRFGRDDFRKRSLPRSTNQEMHQKVDQRRMPQFESNRGVMDKEDLKSKSLDRRDDRRDHRWVDRREDRRDDRRDGRSHEKQEDHRADRHDDRRIARKDDHYNPRVDEHRKQDQKDKACSELAERILDRRENKNWKSDLRLQVKEALRQSIMKILNDMFKDKEASFIEYTVKFRAYYDANDQDKIFDKVMTNLNALPFKRPAPGVREIQPKALRRDLDHRNVKEDNPVRTLDVPGNKTSTSSRHKDKLSQKRPSSDQDKLKPHSKVPRTSGKDAHSKTVSDANVKVEDKLMEVEEKVIAKIEADAQEDAQTGLYALNPLLTRSLEAELQDVMIKVWQVFPDDTDSDAEALVADKFRNQAGDDLRNMLGLNVTQRLLNIFNPLYVKLTFSSPPKRDVFKTFLKKYNITSYKELDPKGLSYLALAKDIATFDSLCNGNQKASGSIKVTVQPCYRFNGCPKNLECSYTKEAKVTDKTIKKDGQGKQKTTEIPKADADKTNKQVNAPIVNKTEAPSAKVSKISEATKANKPIQKQSAESSVTYADKIKTAVKKVSPLAQKASGEKLNKTVPSKAEVTSVKQEPKTPQNKANVTLQKSTATVAKSVKIANKVDSVKAETKTPETKSAVKTVVTKPTGNTTAKIAQTKLPAKAQPQTKAAPKVDDSSASQDKMSKLQSNVSNEVQKKVTVTATKANMEANKAKTPQKSLNTPKIESNPNTNNTGKDKAPTATNNISPKNAKAVAAKTTPNKKPVSKMTPKPKVNNQKNVDYVEDDDEELNDEEILKLLGGGIVLDECSGSDVE